LSWINAAAAEGETMVIVQLCAPSATQQPAARNPVGEAIADYVFALLTEAAIEALASQRKRCSFCRNRRRT